MLEKDREKIYEILTSDDIINSINDNLDYLLELIPELKLMIGFNHNNPNHIYDVWNHTLKALELSSNDFFIRLILLFHDIGKPMCYSEKDGIGHFYNHQTKSKQITNMVLNRLGYDKDFINRVCYFVETHDYLITDSEIENNFDSSLLRREIQYCDGYAHNPSTFSKRDQYFKILDRKLKK